jgi:hypothetical protein
MFCSINVVCGSFIFSCENELRNLMLLCRWRELPVMLMIHLLQSFLWILFCILVIAFGTKESTEWEQTMPDAQSTENGRTRGQYMQQKKHHFLQKQMTTNVLNVTPFFQWKRRDFANEKDFLIAISCYLLCSKQMMDDVDLLNPVLKYQMRLTEYLSLGVAMYLWSVVLFFLNYCILKLAYYVLNQLPIIIFLLILLVFNVPSWLPRSLGHTR